MEKFLDAFEVCRFCECHFCTHPWYTYSPIPNPTKIENIPDSNGWSGNASIVRFASSVVIATATNNTAMNFVGLILFNF